MATVTVDINGRPYAVGCADGQEERIIVQFAFQQCRRISKRRAVVRIYLMLLNFLYDIARGDRLPTNFPRLKNIQHDHMVGIRECRTEFLEEFFRARVGVGMEDRPNHFIVIRVS